jgi:hypothetical protein
VATDEEFKAILEELNARMLAETAEEAHWQMVFLN